MIIELGKVTEVTEADEPVGGFDTSHYQFIA